MSQQQNLNQRAVNTNVQLFENSHFGNVRILPDGDSFWIVAKDVLRALDYADGYDTSRAFSSVPSEWKGLQPLRTLGGTQRILCLSEQGLYFFLGRSDKPKALPYQKWIAGEVVPSIRKTGSYVVETIQQEKDSTIADRVPLLIAIFQAANIEGNQLALALDKVHVRESGYSALQTAEVQLIAPQQRQLYTPTEIGKNVSPIISGIKVNKILKELGWQVKVNDKWEAVQSGEQYAVYLDTGKVHSNGTPVRQLKWTSDTIFVIQDYLNKEIC